MRGGSEYADSERLDRRSELPGKDAVAVVEQELVLVSQADHFAQLLQCSDGAQMSCDGAVANDLNTRAVGDILIALTDGLNGSPEAPPGAVFPATTFHRRASCT